MALWFCKLNFAFLWDFLVIFLKNKDNFSDFFITRLKLLKTAVKIRLKKREIADVTFTATVPSEK